MLSSGTTGNEPVGEGARCGSFWKSAKNSEVIFMPKIQERSYAV